MTYKELFAELDAGRIRNVYFFYGEEDYVRAAALERLRSTILEPGMEDMNETRIEGGTAQSILEAAEQLPMFCKRRLTVSFDFPPLLNRRAKDEERESGRVMEWLDHAPGTGCLVFVVRQDGDGRKKLYKKLHDDFGVEFSLLNEPDAARWAIKRAKALDCAMDADTAEKLVFMAGRALTGLNAQIEKLCAYCMDRQRIAPDDLDAAVTPSGECTVFQMIDAATAGRPLEARRLTKQLIERGESRLGVAALVTRQIRILCHAAKMPADKLQAALDMSPYMAKRAKKQAERLDPKRLETAYRNAVEIDFQVKNGRLREEIALDETLSLLDKIAKK